MFLIGYSVNDRLSNAIVTLVCKTCQDYCIRVQFSPGVKAAFKDCVAKISLLNSVYFPFYKGIS